MDYNVPGGKLNRGLSVVDSVTILKGHELTKSKYFKAGVLGWSVEWLQAYFLVSDDIMDSSITHQGVGLMAVNDALLLEGAIFQMIRQHFHKDPFYVDLLDLMHELYSSYNPQPQVSYQIEMGQLVDLITALEDREDLSKFNLLRYALWTIVLYKTAIYFFYLPITLTLLLCRFPMEKKHESDLDYYKLVLNILLPLGKYFQIQDDYLNYCINTALALPCMTPAQCTILDNNYGRKDYKASARVTQVFQDVGVDAQYTEYKADGYTCINALINVVPEVTSPCGNAVLHQSIFRVFLEKIYKHTK
ncbi:farnesyl diphosphate synthase [Russula decolorans]